MFFLVLNDYGNVGAIGGGTGQRSGDQPRQAHIVPIHSYAPSSFHPEIVRRHIVPPLWRKSQTDERLKKEVDDAQSDIHPPRPTRSDHVAHGP